MNELEFMGKNLFIVLDSLPTNILIINKNAIVSYANKAFQNNFIFDAKVNSTKGPGDFICCVNSQLSELGCGHSEKCSQCALRQYLNMIIAKREKQAPTEILITLLNDFGAEKKWFEVQAIPLMLNSEEQFLVSFMDISIYKKSSFQLLEHKKVAEAANKAKSEFLANMSHEIRTPLNGVIGMLELTLLTSLTDEQRENLDVAKNCADTLLALINDVLDLSKVESNKVVLESQQFNLRELMQRIADTQTAKLLEKDLELKCIIDNRLPPFFYGDEFHLQQILINLISNAVKFTEKGKVIIEVKKLCRVEDCYTIVFSVEDTGIGISPQDINSLFKPFSQVDGSISRKYGGTGLGLAISQNLVHLMGGEIKVKTQKGKGSVFYFTIQLKICEKPVIQNEKSLFEQPPANTDKILVVEDDRANQLVIRQLLYKLGYPYVDIASNGFEAIKQFELKSYKLILMDIQMPELDGIATTHIIREREKQSGKHVPIIALTAHALKGDKEKFIEKGMDAYIPKPIVSSFLKETLDSILHSNKMLQKEQDLKEAYASWNPKPEDDNVNKPISSSDKRLFNTLLAEITILAMSETKNSDTYIQIEKKMHELKIKSQRKEYETIRKMAFRIELAARKKDDYSIQKLLLQLNDLLQTTPTETILNFLQE